MGEFDLIAQYFAQPFAATANSSQAVVLGIGDDCALLRPRAGCELAVSTDMLVAGRHFLGDAEPLALGYKVLAVNLSDLAATGAQPIGFTLALALPAANEQWLADFSKGLLECSTRHACPLVGGDTTRGPLTISITVMGEVPSGTGVRRAGARAGDDIWVSGSVGGAALALRARLDPSLPRVSIELNDALDRPEPRLALGAALRNLAHAMIDVSDGLMGDLQHILDASRVGATLVVPALPLPAELRQREARVALECALAGGDDYELCFTAAVAARPQVEEAARRAQTTVTCIGSITPEPGLKLVGADGQSFAPPVGTRLSSYDHFGA